MTYLPPNPTPYTPGNSEHYSPDQASWSPGLATPPPPPPPKKSRKGLYIVLALVIGLTFIVLAACFAAVGSAVNDAAKTTGVQGVAGESPLPADPCGGGLCEDSPKTPPKGGDLVAASVKLTPQVTDKQCFGSAGCNVTLKVKLAYDGPALDADKSWMVTYQLNGDESGPIVGSFTVNGDRTYEINEEAISTKSSKTKITLKVTGVEKIGI
jgi:hypothetical protein